MRTTVNIDDDVIITARQMAEQREISVGEVLSYLARIALAPREAPAVRNGVPLFTPKPTGKKPHLELVNSLRDGDL